MWQSNNITSHKANIPVFRLFLGVWMSLGNFNKLHLIFADNINLDIGRVEKIRLFDL
jgi:hypothetical protein